VPGTIALTPSERGLLPIQKFTPPCELTSTQSFPTIRLYAVIGAIGAASARAKASGASRPAPVASRDVRAPRAQPDPREHERREQEDVRADDRRDTPGGSREGGARGEARSAIRSDSQIARRSKKISRTGSRSSPSK
jgi:hypothetical protein